MSGFAVEIPHISFVLPELFQSSQACHIYGGLTNDSGVELVLWACAKEEVTGCKG